MLLLGLGIAVAVVGLVALGEEWRRAGSQNARVNRAGLQFELVIACALAIGGGVAMAYAGVAA